MKTSIDGSVEIDAPATTVYDFWTHIERFSDFIPAIESVERIDEFRSRWRASLGFKKTEWVAEITEVIPDKRRAWRTLEGPFNEGMVNFHSLEADRSLMTLHLDYDPKGVIQNLGDELGVVSRVIDRALEEFKDFVEGYS